MKEKHLKKTKIVDDNELIKLLNGEYHIPDQAISFFAEITKNVNKKGGVS